MLKKLMPTTYLLIALILILILHFTFPVSYILMGFWRFFGLVPVLLGILLNLIADRALKEYNTTVKPFQESNTLIIDGIYGVSRHPMYLGFVLILIGISLLLGSTSPYIIVIFFAVLIEFAFIQNEEKMLEEQFPEDWSKYKSNVRKWV